MPAPTRRPGSGVSFPEYIVLGAGLVALAVSMSMMFGDQVHGLLDAVGTYITSSNAVAGR